LSNTNFGIVMNVSSPFLNNLILEWWNRIF
jgi:hypothetical protein